jgi:AraC-like DNA-binding protein
LKLRVVVPVALPVGWSLARHSHRDVCQMLLIRRGRVEATIKGIAYVAGPGDTLLYLSPQPHAERNLGREAIDATHIGFYWPGRRRPMPVLGHDRLGRLAMLVNWLTEIASSPDAISVSTANSLLTAIVFEHERSGTALHHDTALVAHVRSYAQSRLASLLTLKDLADHVGLSRFHFVRRFRAASGVSPIRFVTRLRLEAAHGLLVTTDWPLKQIARAVHFAAAFTFSKAFHREFGQWPSALRSGT